MQSIIDKVALITGGAGKIGQCMVKALLQQGIKGITIVDVNQEAGNNFIDEIQQKYGGNKAIFVQADITNPEEFENAFRKTVDTFQQLDIVINNAGLMDESQWEKTIAVNIVAVTQGTYLAMKKYLLNYKSENEGIIVNIASRLGFDIVPNIPVYCATKHAVVGLGKALGTEDFYNIYKCKILTICPGPVDTPLITSIDNNRFYFPDKIAEEIEMYRRDSFLQTPDNVAKALTDVIVKGCNGSIWFVDSEKPAYEVIPYDGKDLILKQNH